jgi:tRNA(Arg) A34 adenosine deaminase TadA
MLAGRNEFTKLPKHAAKLSSSDHDLPMGVLIVDETKQVSEGGWGYYYID